LDFESIPGIWAAVTGAIIIVFTRQAIRIIRKIYRRPSEIPADNAAIVTLSEDLQRRVLDEQRGAIEPAHVLAWDAAAYRAARRRLRARSRSAALMAALSDLDEARADLRTAWRFTKTEAAGTDAELSVALETHALAIGQFAEASSIFVRVSWTPPMQRPTGEAP
jgi:hypothetical protein